MAKYMAIASYTADGMRGVIAKGGTARVEASRKLIEGAGGSMESFYFAFGGEDVYIVFDLPDNVTAAAVSMNAAASGMVMSRIVVLLTADEVDRAAAHKIHYDAPGS
jgi:uncharacterized protein with GYD domain